MFFFIYTFYYIGKNREGYYIDERNMKSFFLYIIFTNEFYKHKIGCETLKTYFFFSKSRAFPDTKIYS